MEWVRLGNLVVSKDGFVVLHVCEDDFTYMYMPCTSGEMAHVADFVSLDLAYKGVERLLEEPTDLVDKDY